MKERGYAASDIDETIDQAIHAGMIDDRLFAKLWVDDRVLHRPISRRALSLELSERGVPRDLAVAAMREGYPAELEPELAWKAAEARYERLSRVEEEKRLRRTFDYLIRRGFSSGLAREAIRRLEKEAAS